MKATDAKKIILIFVLAVGLHLLFLSLASGLIADCRVRGVDDVLCMVLQCFLKILQFLIPILIIRLIGGITFRYEDFPATQESPQQLSHSPILLFAAALGGMTLLRYIIAGIAHLLQSQHIVLPSASVHYSKTPVGTVLFFLSSVLLPALLEELFYRSMLLRLLLPCGHVIAIVFTALTFGLMHYYPLSIIYAVLIGIILGYCAIACRSLLLCISLHFCNNLIIFLHDLWPEVEQQALSPFLIIDIILLAGGLICTGILLRQIMQNRRRHKVDAAQNNAKEGVLR